MSASFAHKSQLHHSIQFQSVYSCENILATYDKAKLNDKRQRVMKRLTVDAKKLFRRKVFIQKL